MDESTQINSLGVCSHAKDMGGCRMKRNSAKQEPSWIDPNLLYSLKGFERASGVTATRIHHAKQAGIDLPTLAVGRRKFVRGSDAIEYIEALAKNAHLN
jgi:hypothetical protein